MAGARGVEKGTTAAAIKTARGKFLVDTVPGTRFSLENKHLGIVLKIFPFFLVLRDVSLLS
jgi:hypothetical protein